jgi:hypothetical protein
MTGARLRQLLSTGVGSLALAAMGSVQAQTMPQNPAPGMPAGPISAPVPADPRSPSFPGQPISLENAGHSVPGQVSPMEPAKVPAAAPAAPGGCSCGDRHGVSRWWYHKTQCKRRLQECALGYPEEFNEWPLGSSLYAHGRTQVANGNAARMVFYHYDFVDGGRQLNVRGRDKLAKLAKLLPASFCPVLIERTPATPGLDEQRRGLLLAELAGSPFPVPPERVVIGPSPTAGLTGYEAIVLYGNQLSVLQAGGSAGVGGYAGTAGLNAGGLSGGAGGVGSGGGGFGR